MVTLLILDGFGLNKNKKGNAIAIQGTPYLNKLNVFPKAELKASGEEVGLTCGQMGNSEVGHLNLGAGRIVYQDLPRINNDIKNGDFAKNKALNQVITHVKKHNSSLHVMGLLSDGGVHSHINHLKAIVDFASSKGLKKIYIHAFLDGRDTLRDSGINFVRDIENYVNDKARIATLCGRVYAMDRENRYDRIKKTYDMLMYSDANYHYDNAVDALNDSYKNGVYDEFVEPTIIGEKATIESGDAVLFFNYRTDRARELTNAISQPNFTAFKQKELDDLCYCCMTEYSSDFEDVIVAYPPEKIKDNLSAIISENGLKQFHITETTKYAHVTFFFNGGIESPYVNEERKLVDSHNVKDFACVPEMRAPEITKSAIDAIKSNKYDFILINLSNPDMIGHTGNLDATIKAIEVVDKCAYDIANACLEVGADCVITADHGNAEEMIDENNNVLTQHTTNNVPIWLVSDKFKNVKLNNGLLANVAPTILKLLNIKHPSTMINPLF